MRTRRTTLCLLTILLTQAARGQELEEQREAAKARAASQRAQVQRAQRAADDVKAAQQGGLNPAAAARKARIEQLVANQSNVMQRQMDLRLSHVQRVCQPNENQWKKLKIAAKGAVDETVQDYRQRIDGGNAAGANVNPNLGAALAIRASTPATTRVTDHPIWTKALEVVLTPDQRQAYTDSVKARAEFQQRVAMSIAFGLIDGQVELDVEQREGLAKLGQTVLTENVLTVPEGMNVHSLAAQVIIPTLTRQYNQQVKTLLTAEQQVAWDEFSARYARIRFPLEQYLKPRAKP